jgi:hypothetical protein
MPVFTYEMILKAGRKGLLAGPVAEIRGQGIINPGGGLDRSLAHPGRPVESEDVVTPGPARFNRTNPCPICGGHDGLSRGQAVRCFGYYDSSGGYARCTREEHAGDLPLNTDGTYSHRLAGRCRCGHAHGDAVTTPGRRRRPAAPIAFPRRAGQRFRSYFTLAAFLRRRYGDGTAITGWIYRDGGRRTTIAPRATGPATRPRTAAGACRGRTAHFRSSTFRPSSPPRLTPSSSCSKARNAPR